MHACYFWRRRDAIKRCAGVLVMAVYSSYPTLLMTARLWQREVAIKAVREIK